MATKGIDKVEAGDFVDENGDVDLMDEDEDDFYHENGEIIEKKRGGLKAQSAITMASMIRMPTDYDPISYNASAGMARLSGERRKQRGQLLRNPRIPRKNGTGNGVRKPQQKKMNARKKAESPAKCADKSLEDINILFSIASLDEAPKPMPKALVLPFVDDPQPNPPTSFAATLATAAEGAKSDSTGANNVLPPGSNIHAAMSPAAISRAKNGEKIDQTATRYGSYDSPNPFDVTDVIGLPGQVVKCCRNRPGVVCKKFITLQDIADDQLSPDKLALKRRFGKPIDIPDEECTPNQLAAKKQMIADKRRTVRYEQERRLRNIRRETGQPTEKDMFRDMIYYSFWEKKPAGMDNEELEAYKERYFDHCKKLANEQARKLGYPIKFPEVEKKFARSDARKSRHKNMPMVEDGEVGEAEAAEEGAAEDGADGNAFEGV